MSEQYAFSAEANGSASAAMSHTNMIIRAAIMIMMAVIFSAGGINALGIHIIIAIIILGISVIILVQKDARLVSRTK